MDEQSYFPEPLESEDTLIDQDNDRPGWVYVVTNPAWKGWLKIRCTVHPVKRLGG